MKNYKAELASVLVSELKRRGYYDDEKYRDRLRYELKQIEIQEEFEYFWNIWHKGIKYPRNQHNLLVPFLLGIVKDFDISKEPEFWWGDPPDVDIDYLPMVRDYLKNDWAPKTFGEKNVCSIGNYTTFGIKSALIDMTRVHGADRQEILDLTTKLDNKDDEGKPITWEKALESNPKLAEFCEKHPDIAKSAQKLLDRNRGRGKHAGGLIISRLPIDELIPLVTDKDGLPVSAWTEGLHAQDLGPMGFVKYDLLVVTNLMQIARCVKIVKERHGLDHIMAKDGMPDWSDISYLNDPKALALANEGRLKCVFQFDSPGIREMIRRGGVDSFDDLVAYTSLYRPGPLGMGMDKRFIDRKRGEEEYELHSLIKPILGKTYGVMVFQEQVMKILNVVGSIPLIHCEKVRKAISKKKEEVFAKYKVMFIENGQKNLGWKKEDVEDLWNQVVSFAEYGFNKSHAVAYTYISSRLLWLKAHYPLEFFAAILSCESTDEKIKEYKVEAERNGIEICPVDMNKSGVVFQIVDNKIYIGFANVKGIGEEPAKRIVANQPYSSFEDFLSKFGTDASVLKPLLGLRAFKDADSCTLWEFAEHYKKMIKSREDRDKRYRASQELRVAELEKLHNEFAIDGKVDNHLIKSVKKKYKESKKKWLEKVAADGPVKFSEFEPKGLEIPEELKKIFTGSMEKAENKYYGFGWVHPLLSSPDYEGRTFERAKEAIEKGEGNGRVCVEVRIIEKPKQIKSRKNNFYYTVRVEDAEWHVENIRVWEDDYERFKEELNIWDDELSGPLVRLTLKPPDFGFNNFSFWAPRKDYRQRDIAKDKRDDYRLTLMKRN